MKILRSQKLARHDWPCTDLPMPLMKIYLRRWNVFLILEISSKGFSTAILNVLELFDLQAHKLHPCLLLLPKHHFDLRILIILTLDILGNIFGIIFSPDLLNHRRAYQNRPSEFIMLCLENKSIVIHSGLALSSAIIRISEGPATISMPTEPKT